MAWVITEHEAEFSDVTVIQNKILGNNSILSKELFMKNWKKRQGHKTILLTSSVRPEARTSVCFMVYERITATKTIN